MEDDHNEERLELLVDGKSETDNERMENYTKLQNGDCDNLSKDVCLAFYGRREVFNGGFIRIRGLIFLLSNTQLAPIF